MTPLLDFDERLIDDVAARFDLRDPNREGLRETVFRLSSRNAHEPIVLDMATGVGKTYLLAALLDYAAGQGVKNMLVVLPGRTVRAKTIANFTPGADGYIDGADHDKTIVTVDNFEAVADEIRDPNRVKLFLTNVHNLEPDFTIDHHGLKAQAARTYRAARTNETLGGKLLEYLADAPDLLMVLDESHTYSDTARAWSAALDRLAPAARVGLTATPKPGDDVIYRYTLADAIRDRHVKTPVVAMRRGGYRDNVELEQLRDARRLLDRKTRRYREYERSQPDAARINPIMLVACRDTAHADEIAAILRGPQFFASEEAVLVIHSDAMTDAAEAALAGVQRPDSPVRAIVQVQMLTEGWNVHNVAVLVPLRALESATFTEQLIGRGLRLPYHAYTGDEMVDSLDILSHESVRSALLRHGVGHQRDALEPDPDLEPTPAGAPGGETTEVGERPDPVAGPTVPLDPATAAGTGGVADAVADLGGQARDLDATIGTTGTGEAGGAGGAHASDTPGLDEPGDPEPVWIARRDSTRTLRFPSVRLRTDPARFQLDSLDSTDITAIADAAKHDDYRDALERDIVILDSDGNVTFEGAAHALIELDPTEMPRDAVKQTVTLHTLQHLTSLFNGADGETNEQQLPVLIDRIIDRAGGTWSKPRAAQLGRILVRELRRHADDFARNRPMRLAITPTSVPQREPVRLHYGDHTHYWRDAHDNPGTFQRGRYYDGWRRDWYTASRFDAHATEFEIARMLDEADDIESWMRLEPADQARIEYRQGRFYHPDFIAIDTSGIHWIIEGKAEHGRDDQDVQDKRRTAERAVRVMDGDPAWAGTRWAYLIAYQDDVASNDTWTNLKSATNPEIMRRP